MESPSRLVYTARRGLTGVVRIALSEKPRSILSL
jgi:hypothetical protein